MTTYTWIGNSGAFGTAGNWTPNGVPGSGDTAIFATGTGAISGTGSVGALSFTAGNGWVVSGQLQAGTIGVLDSLAVQNGGTLTATAGPITLAGNNNSAATLVIYAGSTLSSTVAAQTAASQFLVAGGTGSTASVLVTGAGATLNMGANQGSIGNAGTGSLTVQAGGTASFASSNSFIRSALFAGIAPGSNGAINVSGTGSSVTASGYVFIGRGGTGTLTVSGGGTFTGGSAATNASTGFSLAIGDGTPALDANGNPNTTVYYGGSGTADVTGSGSLLHSLNQLRVGSRGTSGTLTVENAAIARADASIIVGGGTDRAGAAGTLLVQTGGSVVAGGAHTTGSAGISFGNDTGTTGTGIVTGSGSVLNANGDRLTVGGNGAGTLTISGGGRALSGASYTDVEAALAVAGGTGSTGTLTISGAGSALTATGDAVIGGNEKGAGPTVGGTGTVSVTGGGTLSISGTTTIQAGGSLTVDGASTLNAAAITLNGGTATLATLSSSSAITFGSGGTLAVSTVSGSNAIGNFGFGDTIDLLGTKNATLSGNVVTTSTGALTLAAAPANTSYQLLDDGNGGELVALTPKTVGVYRFFDSTYGTHFYTASASEAQSVAAARPDLVPEGPGGIGLQAVAVQASDPNAVAVYRFFDTVYGTHFFTASASERDNVIAARPDLQYEPSSVFYEHATQQPGDTAVYRFFDSVRGTHFYTDSPSERANIVANRSDLVAEGVGFYEPRQNYMS